MKFASFWRDGAFVLLRSVGHRSGPGSHTEVPIWLKLVLVVHCAEKTEVWPGNLRSLGLFGYLDPSCQANWQENPARVVAAVGGIECDAIKDRGQAD